MKFGYKTPKIVEVRLIKNYKGKWFILISLDVNVKTNLKIIK